MHDVKVGRDDGFPGIGQVLLSQQYRRLMERGGNTAALLYQALVAKRTGELARDVQVRTHIGGLNNDRWVATVVVGENVIEDLPHEFGWTPYNKRDDKGRYASRDNDDVRGEPVAGAHDLDQVLKMLGGAI